MAFVERQYVRGRVALGKYGDRSVGKTQLDVLVLVHDIDGAGNVISIERLELIRPVGDFVEKGDLGLSADAGGEEVIELGQYEGRKEQRRFGGAKRLERGRVLALAAVDRSQQPARIEKDQTSPKPFRASSTVSAKSAWPLSKRGKRGARGSLRATTSATPSRMRSASLRRRRRAARANASFNSDGR